jgi:tRNA A-37 threonylcarbamoyl transferase component Bud32
VLSAACCCRALTLSLFSQCARTTAAHCCTHATHYVQSVPNGTLKQLLEDKGGALPYSQVQFFAACMVLAVEDLHRAGMTHNDLKPDNVLLDAQVPATVITHTLCCCVCI